MNLDLAAIDQKDLEGLKAFQPADWPDITKAYAFYIPSPYCQPLKLMENGEIRAIGCAIRHAQTAWLAQIIVAEPYRNRGLGSKMTQCLIDLVKPEVRSISLVATDLGAPVYTKLGFRPVAEYSFFRRAEPLPPNPESGVADLNSSILGQVLELDLEASGEDRSLLIRDHLENGKVISSNSVLYAYYLPTLGEGLIISRDEKAGQELMRLKLSARLRHVIPEGNATAKNFLLENCFEPYRKALRMVLGDPVHFKPEWIYSRIGGNLG